MSPRGARLGAPALVALAAALAAATLAAPPAHAAPRPPRLNRANAPALIHLRVDAGVVRAWSDPDSAGQVVAASFDARTRRWSRPAPYTPPALSFADSLGWVHEFAGG